MSLRKQRVIHSGLTNVDFKTKGDTLAVDRYNPDMKYADMGTMSKTGLKIMAQSDGDPMASLKLNSGWQTVKPADPKVETAMAFYNAQGKKAKAPVLVSNRLEQHLEPAQWTDKVFTGDNSKTTAMLSQEAEKRDQAINPTKRRVVAESVTKAIEERLARAAKSKLEERVDTLDKAIDKKHVMDIRRALRRKYASRTNLHRIFSQWDKECKGGISPADLFLGLNKIGISASLDEARALHSLATQTDNDPNLSLQEFSDLLFTADESFNGDSLARQSISDKQMEADLLNTMKESTMARTIDLKALEPEVLAKLTERNRWKACIQRNLQNITKDLLVVDT